MKQELYYVFLLACYAFMVYLPLHRIIKDQRQELNNLAKENIKLEKKIASLELNQRLKNEYTKN